MSVPTKAPTLPVLRPASYTELVQFAEMAARSTMAPPAYRGKPEDVMLAVQLGSEIGLAPMQALQSVAVINGRPAVFGDAIIGLCRASAVCEDIIERFEGEGDNLRAVCIAKRRGAEPVVATFSVADAKKAGLWGKAGPWTQYPKRMLQMRARSFACRDAFPDVLRGLIAVEEAQDIAVVGGAPFAGSTIDGVAEPGPPVSREAFNAAVPLAPDPPPPEPEPPKKRVSFTAWRAEIEALIAAATTPAEMDVIEARDDVGAVIARGTEKQRNAVHDLIAAARQRIGYGVGDGPEEGTEVMPE